MIFIKGFDDGDGDGDDDDYNDNDIWGDFATGKKVHKKKSQKQQQRKKKSIFIYLKIKSLTLNKVPWATFVQFSLCIFLLCVLFIF